MGVWRHSLKQRDSKCKHLEGGTGMDSSGSDLGESSCRDQVGSRKSRTEVGGENAKVLRSIAVKGGT